jgi:hypothetical protein
VPSGTVVTSRVQKSRIFTRVLMYTTDAFDLSNKSMVACSSLASGVRGVISRGVAFGPANGTRTDGTSSQMNSGKNTMNARMPSRIRDVDRCGELMTATRCDVPVAET